LNTACSITQEVVTVQYLDCPGQPIEQSTLSYASPECDSDTPEVQNFNYGASWNVSLTIQNYYEYPAKAYRYEGSLSSNHTTSVSGKVILSNHAAKNHEEGFMITNDLKLFISDYRLNNEKCAGGTLSRYQVKGVFDGHYYFNPNDYPTIIISFLIDIWDTPPEYIVHCPYTDYKGRTKWEKRIGYGYVPSVLVCSFRAQQYDLTARQSFELADPNTKGIFKSDDMKKSLIMEAPSLLTNFTKRLSDIRFVVTQN